MRALLQRAACSARLMAGSRPQQATGGGKGARACERRRARATRHARTARALQQLLPPLPPRCTQLLHGHSTQRRAHLLVRQLAHGLALARVREAPRLHDVLGRPEVLVATAPSSATKAAPSSATKATAAVPPATATAPHGGPHGCSRECAVLVVWWCAACVWPRFPSLRERHARAKNGAPHPLSCWAQQAHSHLPCEPARPSCHCPSCCCRARRRRRTAQHAAGLAGQAPRL